MKSDSFPVLESVSFLCWILKDLGWCLLSAPLGFAGAGASIGIEAFLMSATWYKSTAPVRCFEAATDLWLLGNASWMLAELLFDPADKPALEFLYRWSPVPVPVVTFVLGDTTLLVIIFIECVSRMLLLSSN